MSDTLFALWIGLSVAMLLLFLFAAVASLRNRQGRPVALEELIPSFVPVDVEAFADLIGSAADGVGQELSPEEFVALQRRRTQLAMKSLRRMASNAALLQRLGYSQLHCGNPLISDLAQQMIDAGVHVRLYTFIGLVVLRASSIFRLTSIEVLSAAKVAELQNMLSGSLIPSYEQLKDKAGNLACLKFSGLHEALSQSL
ncbi:MAG TPA: hypothetical protein VN669_11795 [Candidatus Acidoferrales bacterium]|jgi:hypothetical protein|nr:hypothetical protein [Candidatus Acidoferrales bacterium]